MISDLSAVLVNYYTNTLDEIGVDDSMKIKCSSLLRKK